MTARNFRLLNIRRWYFSLQLLQDRQDRLQLSGMELSGLIDVLVKHIALTRNVTNVFNAAS